MTHKQALVVSHAGSSGVFAKVEADLVKQLATQKTDWTYGHNPHNVKLEISSYPFEVAISHMNDALSKQPLLHIFWTDAETEAYRSSVKDQLAGWLEKLREHGCTDYLIIHATFQDKHNILPKFAVTRTSFVEKVKSDFGASRSERCLSFKAEPTKVNASHSQSWLIVIGKVRDHILKSVTAKLTNFEKIVNQIRDKHQTAEFELFEYIRVKEELCSVYELTGLHEEAYRSCEEILSLFRQYVSGLRYCQIIPWLVDFVDCKLTSWEGLYLSDNFEEEILIGCLQPDQLTNVQLCCLVFRRIAKQLAQLERPEDLAKKGLQFLLSVVHETKLLKATYPKGAMTVWVYVSCIELIEAVKVCSPASLKGLDTPGPLAIANAQLFELARQKLYDLGELAGYVGKHCITEEEIKVLTNGAKREETTTSPDTKTVIEELESIMFNKCAFHKQYLVLCQHASIMFKQGGWDRHSQYTTLQQALYLKERGEATQCLNAELDLRDVCQMYDNAGWDKLATQSRVYLATTQCDLQLTDKEIVTCAHLATETEHLSTAERSYYCQRLVTCVTELSKAQSQLCVPLSPLFDYSLPLTSQTPSVLHVPDTLLITLNVINCSAATIEDAAVSVRLECQDTLPELSSAPEKEENFSSVPIEGESEFRDVSLRAQSSVSDDGQLNGAKKQIWLTSPCCTLTPGDNTVTLRADLTDPGRYMPVSLEVEIGSLSFKLVSPPVPAWFQNVVVEEESPSVVVTVIPPVTGVLLSGRLQTCTLKVVAEKACKSLNISLSSPTGLTLQGVTDGYFNINDGEDEGCFSLTKLDSLWSLALPALLPHKPVTLSVPVLSTNDEEPYQQHLLDVTWVGGGLALVLTFHQPLLLSSSLKFYENKMYLLAEVTCNIPSDIQIDTCELVNGDPMLPVVPFSPCTLIPSQKMCAVWSMDRDSPKQYSAGAELRIQYTLPGSDEQNEYKAHLSPPLVSPLFTITVNCISARPSIGSVCTFEVVLECSQKKGDRLWRMLYEVAVDRSQWSVCGYQRRQIDVSTTTTFTVELLPIRDGVLEYPQILLWEYSEPHLRTVSNQRDLNLITSAPAATELTQTMSDPLGAENKSPIAKIRKRSVSSLPRAEKIDYSDGKEKISAVIKIVLNTLTNDSLSQIAKDRICFSNGACIIQVAS